MNMPKLTVLSLTSLLAVNGIGPAFADSSRAKEDDAVDRGHYLVRVAGCNDCHTPGYGANNGNVDEKLWLTGDNLGWSGPWGTTYATNLRLLINDMTRQQWIARVRAMETRPPMPWFNLKAMSDRDLSALYAYVKALGPAGQAAPAYVPPGTLPTGPVVRFPE